MHSQMRAHAQPYQVCLAHLSSDGMSRSGVFITCMSEIERVKVEGAVDIFQTVKAARTQRPHMVYTSVSCYENVQYCMLVTMHTVSTHGTSTVP